MIIQMLTPELSRHTTARARRPSPMLALGLLGLLGTAACSGSVDDNKDDVANSRPATSDTASDRGGARDTTSTGTSNAADDTDPRDVNSREQEADDLSNATGSRSNAGSRRGGGTRRVRDEVLSDAGAIDAGDAGEADGGVVEVDAGVAVDAGAVDAGQ
jgi:hypothetical protein